MQIKHLISLLLLLILFSCREPIRPKDANHDNHRVDQGNPVSVMLTVYSTTLLADGKDEAQLRIALLDSINREIIGAKGEVYVYIEGDGSLALEDGSIPKLSTDEEGLQYVLFSLSEGIAKGALTAGTTPGKIRLEARVDGLWPGGHEIHCIPASTRLHTPSPEQLSRTNKPIGRMIGADVSWLPEMESEGMKFYWEGIQEDGIRLMRKLGFNTIRLRIFVNPENEEGYSPGKGFCGLESTLEMAKRVRDSGMDFLLDFHYSDTWADPQKQFKPLAWEGLRMKILLDTVRSYTAMVMQAFHRQGTPPDMVQVGNEINHGMIWPEGHISNPDGLAALLRAGIEGVETVDPEVPVMMHLALGGQNKEAVFWLDNMIARDVRFDIIGLSYYPRWHGTPEDLEYNLNDLLKRYHKPLNVVEYSDYKRKVHEIVFGLPNNMGKGTAIWEPLRWGSIIVDPQGNIMESAAIFNELKKEYLD